MAVITICEFRSKGGASWEAPPLSTEGVNREQKLRGARAVARAFVNVGPRESLQRARDNCGWTGSKATQMPLPDWMCTCYV